MVTRYLCGSILRRLLSDRHDRLLVVDMTTDPITAPIHTLWRTPNGIGMKQCIYRKDGDLYIILSYTDKREHNFGKINGIWQLAYCKPEECKKI